MKSKHVKFSTQHSVVYKRKGTKKQIQKEKGMQSLYYNIAVNK